MANKPLKSIQFPGLTDTYTVPVVDNTLAVTGAAADAKKVGDELSDLKGDISELSQTVLHEYTDASLWVSGTIDGKTGANATSNIRIRTKNFLPTNITGFRTDEGYSALLYVWDNDAYNGAFDGEVNNKTYSLQAVTEYTFPQFATSRYKIVLKRNDDATIALTDSEHIHFITNAEASPFDNDKTSVPIVTYWTNSIINKANGDVVAEPTRILSGYISGDSIFGLKMESDYKALIYVYDSELTYIGAWLGLGFGKSSTVNMSKVYAFAFESGKYYRIAIGKEDNSQISISDSSKIGFYTDIMDAIETPLSLSFEQGGISILNGTVFEADNRLRSSRLYPTHINKVYAKEGYKIIVYAYNSALQYVGAWTGTTFKSFGSTDELVYVSEYTIDHSLLYIYRFVLLKETNEALTVNDAENLGILINERLSQIEYDVAIGENKEELPIHSDNCIFTLGYTYVKRENDTFYLSVDGGESYTKNIGVPDIDGNTFGVLRNAYVFKNGTFVVFDHQHAYYTDDWVEWHQSTCLDISGQAYVPTQYDTFTVAHRPPRTIIDGEEILVFGNYNITNESSNRTVIWYSVDNGHTFKVAYEFNVSGAAVARHIHGVYYCKHENNFWVTTGDNALQSHLMKGVYDFSSDTWQFSVVATGANYKWACLAFYNDHFYYARDYTPGIVLEGKIGDESDVTKHYVILDDLPNDVIGLFVGEQVGEMLVSISMYRTGTSTSPNTANYDSKRMWYSANRRDFVEINGNRFSELNVNGSSFFRFCGPNAEGKILAGFEKSTAAGGVFVDNDSLPSVYLDNAVRNAGFDCNFK